MNQTVISIVALLAIGLGGFIADRWPRLWLVDPIVVLVAFAGWWALSQSRWRFVLLLMGPISIASREYQRHRKLTKKQQAQR